MRSIRIGWSILLAGVICVSLLPLGGCDDDNPTDPISELPPPSIPPPTSPENLIEALQVIYNDPVRTAEERLEAYRSLFSPANHDSLPDFLFRFQPSDVAPGEDPTWGLDAELQAHQNMFAAQTNRDIFSIELTIQYNPATELQFPEPGQENWREVFATNVFLRLMFNPQDGLLVDGGQAKFLCAPADGRWYIVEWMDIARPFAPGYGTEIEENTWGSIKSIYRG